MLKAVIHANTTLAESRKSNLYISKKAINHQIDIWKQNNLIYPFLFQESVGQPIHINDIFAETNTQKT